MKKKLLMSFLAAAALLTGCTGPGGSAQEMEGPVIIALLDTGVSTLAISPEQLLPGHNYVTGTADTEDRINHGTAVAGTILGSEGAGAAGLAPNSMIVPLVVTDKVEEVQSVSSQILAQAVRDSVDKYGADIINISLGLKKDVPELKSAVEYAVQQGALVVSAVGNDGGSEEHYYPAAYEQVLGVGSHNEEMEESSFSQKNGDADLLAPGEDIWLVSKNGKTYGARGTSYATGYVSGAAALLLESTPKLSGSELRELLCTHTRPVKDSSCGALDLDACLNKLNAEN